MLARRGWRGVISTTASSTSRAGKWCAGCGRVGRSFHRVIGRFTLCVLDQLVKSGVNCREPVRHAELAILKQIEKCQSNRLWHSQGRGVRKHNNAYALIGNKAHRCTGPEQKGAAMAHGLTATNVGTDTPSESVVADPWIAHAILGVARANDRLMRLVQSFRLHNLAPVPRPACQLQA